MASSNVNLIDVALGNLSGYSFEFVHGRKKDVGATNGQVWTAGEDAGPDNITLPTTPVVISLVSDSAADDDGSTGCRKVRVRYLDDNWKLAEEVVTMNGTSAVTTVATAIRHIESLVEECGSGGENAGTITITMGGNAQGEILPAGELGLPNFPALGNTNVVFFTVPADKKAVLLRAGFSASAANTNVLLHYRQAAGANAKRTLRQWRSFLAYHQEQFRAFHVFEPKTDIWMSGHVDAGSSFVHGSFDLMLIPNE